MSDSPPEFKSGNRWFVAALNQVISYARGHGVNCKGVPGWSWTADGWQPPRIRAGGEIGAFPWDLDVVSSANLEVSVTLGTILKSSDSCSVVLTCSNPTDTFTVEAGGYISIMLDFAESEDVTTYTVRYDSEWPVADNKPVEYSGTPGGEDFQLAARYYPLYKIVGTNETGSVSIGAGAWAIRLAPKEHLRVVVQYFQVAEDDAMFLAPGLEVSPRAFP